MADVTLPVYLDYQATTPLDPRVLDVMMPYLTEKFGNPHSAEHKFGWEADAGVALARKQVADLIGAMPEEIIFTSGATESNNMAIKGFAYAASPTKNHIVTAVTEHPCVLESCRALERSGFHVTYLAVDRDGIISDRDVAAAMTPQTSLVSLMAVNNEIGVIQNLKKIGQICANENVIFHVDAAQAVGKIPLDMRELNISLLSISGHKIYGPKGVGALYINKDITPKPLALFDGGGQERGLRSGTLSPALCAGLGAACHLAGRDMGKDHEHIAALSEKLTSSLTQAGDGLHFNGAQKQRYVGNLNFYIEGVKGDELVKELRNLALSTGSACSTTKSDPSHVLTAIGLTKKQIEGSIRIGIGRMTSLQEIDYAAEEIIRAVTKIKNREHKKL